MAVTAEKIIERNWEEVKKEMHKFELTVFSDTIAAVGQAIPQRKHFPQVPS